MSDNKQIKKRDYDKVLVDFSERFYKLRHDHMEEGKKKSFKDISNEIENLTDGQVSISHTQLAKYYKISLDEDDETTLTPNIKSILAIADYYNVSVEYLLGISNTKSYKDKYKVGSEAFGLSDETMKVLEQMKFNRLRGSWFDYPYEPYDESIKLNNFKGSDFVNFLLTDYIREMAFYIDYYFSAVKYHQGKRDKSVRSDNFGNPMYNAEDTTMIKYRITQSMEKFLERIQQELLNEDTKKEID